ncbi:hypothetical protein IWQ60_008521 [Tieghemiomyces parasiticus]|uniref:MAGE domain-containing protein n=1 Tax=Tieghemiomyces parasiticus TaxID=78921 RepID=A0A9W8A165_9FUNG|nr:hypothetical protein IWQ60_008521 [Tieghemiomyces parasiticus]
MEVDTHSTSGTTTPALSEAQDRKVNDLVRLALFSEYRKYPIKREDINRRILVDQTRTFPVIFTEAQKRLRHVFGLEMVELPARDKPGATQGNAVTRRAAQSKDKAPTAKTGFILRNLLAMRIPKPHPDLAEAETGAVLHWGNENRMMGIVATILSLIFLNQMAIPGERLEYYLQRLDLQVSSADRAEEKYPFAAVLAPLVKQGYLERISLGARDGTGAGASGDTTGPRGGGGSGDAATQLVEYRWGPRAKVEYPPRRLAGFIAELYQASGQPIPETNAEDSPVPDRS